MDSQSASSTGTAPQQSSVAGEVSAPSSETKTAAQAKPGMEYLKSTSTPKATAPRPEMAIFYFRRKPQGELATALLPVPRSYEDAKSAAVHAFDIDNWEQRHLVLLVDMSSIDDRCGTEAVGLREESWALIESARPFWTGPLKLYAVVSQY